MLQCQPDIKLYTDTRQGKIPNMLANVGGYDLSMPVKMTLDKQGCPQPATDKYGYIFALPAGYVINLNGDISK